MNEGNVVTQFLKVANDMRGNKNGMIFISCEINEHLHDFITNYLAAFATMPITYAAKIHSITVLGISVITGTGNSTCEKL